MVDLTTKRRVKWSTTKSLYADTPGLIIDPNAFDGAIITGPAIADIMLPYAVFCRASHLVSYYRSKGGIIYPGFQEWGLETHPSIHHGGFNFWQAAEV